MKVCMIGAGVFSLSLSHLFKKNNKEVIIWSAINKEVETLNKKRTHEKLSKFKLHEDIKVTNDLKEAISKSTLICIAVPSNYVKSVMESISKYIKKDQYILIASKGMDLESNSFLFDIVKKYVKSRNISLIAGPTFAKDIVLDEYIGLVVASHNSRLRKLVKYSLESYNVKVKETSDILGTEMCSTLKNVIAIASGILSGMKVSESTKALFLNESIIETINILDRIDADYETALNLPGIGDIILTATGESSRNFTYGTLIGEGKFKDAKKYLETNTVEGYNSLNNIVLYFKKKRIRKTLFNVIYDIVNEIIDKEELLKYLIEKRNNNIID